MKKCRLTVKTLILALAASTLLLSGCVNSTAVGPDPMDASGALPPVSSFADDIQDIVIPTDMEWQRDQSMAIKTESFRGGIWHYQGKLEIISLKDFMVTSMEDNKWKLVGEATSKNIMLAFTKPNKTCMMILEDANFSRTNLTLYVTIDKTATAALNPFGEAVNQ
jgi:hypothetical protein